MVPTDFGNKNAGTCPKAQHWYGKEQGFQRNCWNPKPWSNRWPYPIMAPKWFSQIKGKGLQNPRRCKKVNQTGVSIRSETTKHWGWWHYMPLQILKETFLKLDWTASRNKPKDVLRRLWATVQWLWWIWHSHACLSCESLMMNSGHNGVRVPTSWLHV